MKKFSYSLVILCAAATSILWGGPPNQNDDDWATFNKDYAGTRFSALDQITKTNVSKLKQVCSFPLPESVSFQSGPVVVDGTMYFTTFEYTYAMDAGTCALKWKSRHPLPSIPPLGTNRGVAYLDGKLFRGTVDGYVLAYDASNGRELWKTKVISNDSEEYLSAAPVAWNGLVFAGSAGADGGQICHVIGLDMRNGEVKWKFALVPTGDAPGAETWPKGTTVAGGSTWSSYTLDPSAGLLYVPSGNPGPDFAGAYRPGANLYTGSVVVLQAKTGELKTWYQIVPHDTHDYDIAAAPALITNRAGEKLVLVGAKDGHLHALDPATGKILRKTEVTTISNNTAPISPDGTRFCPGTLGGVEWNGPSYSPQNNTAFVNSVDWCVNIKLGQKPPHYEKGKNFLGSAANDFGAMDNNTRKSGWVTAVDADSGAVRWRYPSVTPMVSGITSTAAGLVFTGDLNGSFFAFDGDTGQVLYRKELAQPVGGGIITYGAAGKQRVAVAAGLQSGIWETKGKPAIFIFGLGEETASGPGKPAATDVSGSK